MICVQFRNLQIRATMHTQTENTLPTNHKSDNVCFQKASCEYKRLNIFVIFNRLQS